MRCFLSLLMLLPTLTHAGTPSLSEILAKELTATQLDSDLNTPEFQDFIKKLVAYKKKKISMADKAILLQLCDKFRTCRYIDKVTSDPIIYNESGAIRKKLRRMSIAQIKKHIRKNELSRLDDIRVSSLTKAFDRYETLESLAPIIKNVQQPNSCRSSEFLLSLALKVEDFFPARDARDQAIQLYTRIGECAGKDSAAAQRATYRLSLIHLWNSDCTQAEKSLLELSSRKDSEYGSRSFYWLAKCAKQSGKRVAFEEYRERLYKANPISYYLLLLHQGELDEWSKIHRSENDSEVSFRSKSATEINSGLYLIEGLLLAGQNDIARTILRNLEKKSLAAESQVRLYMAALAHRLNENIMQFKLLDTVFREDSAQISTRTLKMFFPLKQFSIVWEHRETVDPYLVAALIRQESGFNARARSPVGAMGLMQLMPRTAKQLGRVTKKQLFDPEMNVKLGVKYFKNLMNRFDGDAELALAGYNAGPQRVEDWVKRFPIDDRMLFIELIPFSETRKYISLINRNYYWYLSLYGVKDGAALIEINRNLASSRQNNKTN